MVGGDTIAAGNSSGYQAINIAALYGCKRIILLGYDCQAQVVDNKCVTHWFGGHPDKTDPSVFKDQLAWYKTLLPDLATHGIELINATRTTALDFFPRLPIEEALK